MKKILITFNSIKGIQSHAVRESLVSNLITEKALNGGILKDFSVPSVTERYVTFDDGDEIHVMPLSKVNRGERYTHIYLEESLIDISNKLSTLLIGASETYDTSGSRLNCYGIKNENLFIKKIQ